MSTLSGHTKGVNALCSVNIGQLVSGSWDNSLIIWSQSRPESSIYSLRQVLRGHTSCIRGIIRIKNSMIVSGERKGDLRMWDLDQGLCIRHIPRLSEFGYLHQMKQHIGGDLLVSDRHEVNVWGAANNWDNIPIKQFNNVCDGCLIEFLDGDLLLRGGLSGQLEFIDYAQTGCKLPPIIMGVHSKYINAIQQIAKNIVITASADGYLKVIHPISRKLYLSFKKNEGFNPLAYFY